MQYHFHLQMDKDQKVWWHIWIDKTVEKQIHIPTQLSQKGYLAVSIKMTKEDMC